MSEDNTAGERVAGANASDSQTEAGRTGEGDNQQNLSQPADKSGLLRDLHGERKKRQELEQRLQDLERQKLEAEGKKDELLQNYKKELNEYKTMVANSIKSKVEDQVILKARELGCIDDELLVKAIDLDSVEVDRGTFKITNTDSVVGMIEGLRKKKPHLFKQQGPQFKDGTPNNRPNTQPTGKTLNQMSTAELIEFARKSNVSTQ